MKKQKGMIITAAVLLAAAAVVTGSRLIRHPEKSNTKKSEVADQENSEKEQDHRTSGTELSEKKQNMNEPDHTQKEQSVENAGPYREKYHRGSVLYFQNPGRYF